MSCEHEMVQASADDLGNGIARCQEARCGALLQVETVDTNVIREMEGNKMWRRDLEGERAFVPAVKRGVDPRLTRRRRWMKPAAAATAWSSGVAPFGPGSVIDLLEKAGYTVKRIQ